MDADSTRFVDEFAPARFRHSEALIAGLRDGNIVFSSASEESAQKVGAYLDIYEFRLRGIRTRNETDHTKSLKLDVEELCQNMRNSDPEEPCDLWTFLQAPDYIYSVFVSRNSRQVLGCVRGVDDRLIDDQRRRELWGRNSNESNGDNKSR